MANYFLEHTMAWEEMARACEYTCEDEDGQIGVRLFWCPALAQVSYGLCGMAGTLLQAGKICQPMYREIQTTIEHRAQSTTERYGSRNCYLWPHTKEGWEARRQFCLEQERLCRTQGPLAWRT